MRLDQFSGVIAFLKVAETRSFTRAAAELGVTAPSLSEAIKGLEARLGVRLLNRTTRSVGLTEAGSAYLERVRPAAAEIQSAGAALKDMKDRPAGVLRLNLPWIAAPLFIEPLLADFLDTYPEIGLDLVFDDGLADLAARGFDAGIRIGELLEKDMVAVRLGGPVKVAVLASPDYLAKNGTPKHPADLAHHHCVAYRFSSMGALAPWEFIEKKRRVEFTPKPRLAANAMTLVFRAAVEGLGLVYAPEALGVEHVEKGALVKVLQPFCPTYAPFHIYYLGRRLMPPKLRTFVDFARRRFRA